ncbi:MAG: hypothetical protein EOO11_13730 [Chitinophagaceae bacterium]|nr:MAG: hypothetical protein EOO11_13730 [Chitinophagaceae bacterium]
MMKRILLLCSLLTAFAATAQETGAPDLGDPRYVVRRKLQQYAASLPRAAALTESDTSVVLRVPAGSGTVAFSYYFGKDSLLTAYKYSECDPCVAKYLAGQLSDKQLGWRPVSDSLYLSRPSARRRLQTGRDAAGAYFMVSSSPHTRKQWAVLPGSAGRQ